MNNLGYRTDCLLHSRLGEVIRKPEYFVIRNPNNPSFYWGNLLLFRDAPKEESAELWMRAYREEFGEKNGHVTFGWESESIGDLDSFKKWGFDYEPLSVMTRQEAPLPAKEVAPPPDGIVCREIESDEDWTQLMELHRENYQDEKSTDGTGFRIFVARKFANYRKLTQEGYGFWMGAFSGSRLVGNMGLFWDLEQKLARFQNVETAVDFRRRGVCSSLLNHTLWISSLLCEIQTWVIAADVGSGAERLYHSQGFRKVGMQHGVCCPRHFDYDLHF